VQGGRSREADLALARAAALGDRLAFEEVVHRHGPVMLRYARRVLRDRGDAEEAVQDALVTAWRTMERFRGDSALRTWLLGITSHKAADVARRRRPHPVDDEVLGSTPADARSDPLSAASSVALEDALAALPYGQRSAWVLVELEGMTQAEAAEIMGTTPDSVRGNLFRARRRLGERMARWRP
jgi:RNA polymerase sigma-70 factor, ECF subfamily